MKKLLIALLMMIPLLASAQSSLMGVQFGTPVKDFVTRMNSKSKELASVAHAKKCKIEVNKNLPGDIKSACVATIEFEYKSSEAPMGFTVICSALTSRYGKPVINEIEMFSKEGVLTHHVKDYIFYPKFGEVVLSRDKETVTVTIIDYTALQGAYLDLFMTF